MRTILNHSNNRIFSFISFFVAMILVEIFVLISQKILLATKTDKRRQKTRIKKFI